MCCRRKKEVVQAQEHCLVKCVVGVLLPEPSSLRRSGVAVAARTGRRRRLVMAKRWQMGRTVDLTATLREFGVQTLNKAFRKPWPSTLHVGGGRSYFQMRGRCMVRNFCRLPQNQRLQTFSHLFGIKCPLAVDI